MKFAWIAAEWAGFTVADCCRALAVSPSGFYVWQGRAVPIPVCCITPHQGCTYAAEDYRTGLEHHGITCSMSRR